MFIAGMTKWRMYILGHFFQNGWPLGFWKSLPIFCFISSIEVDEGNIGITFAPGAPAEIKSPMINKYNYVDNRNNKIVSDTIEHYHIQNWIDNHDLEFHWLSTFAFHGYHLINSICHYSSKIIKHLYFEVCLCSDCKLP